MSRVALFIMSACALVYILWVGADLPPQVASHFDVAGTPDAFMSRSLFVACGVLVATGVPWLVWFLIAIVMRHPSARIPNAEYWRSPGQWPKAEAFLASRATMLAVVLCVFLCYCFTIVAFANGGGGSTPRLNMSHFLWALIAFLAVVAAWIAHLNRHFHRV